MEKNEIFSYPYNFVSLGDEKQVNRSARIKGNNSGKIKCTLKNITPIFIGNKTNTKEEKTLTIKVEGTEKYVIPASTLKGEIRNIIEVITRSCIKNVEEERLDYRGSIRNKNKNNIFGIIKKFPTTNDDGIILGADKIKVKFYDINNKQEGLEITERYNKEGFYKIKVNDKYKKYIDKGFKPTKVKNADDPNAVNSFEQFQNIIQGGTIEAVLWVSSNIFNKKYQKILVPNGEKYSFTNDEYEDLKYLIKQRKENEEKNKKSFYIDELKVGDAIIFEEIDNNRVKSLAFSEIPRLRYKISPLDLVPKEFHPCTTEKLCFACRLFGTTGDTSENKSEETKTEKITAMISKVFISDALSIKPKDRNMEDQIILSPLGEPHPSMANFYLENGTYDNEKTQIRGRKFYWHHSEKIKIGTGYKSYLESISDNEKQKYNSKICFIKPNQNFEFEVFFKDLTNEELGVLIYSLELEKDLLHKFGKAKALGLGSCEIKIIDCLLENDKYNTFISSYTKFDKQKFLSEVIKKYNLDTDVRKEIEELKTILNKTNNLNFKESPFPKESKKGKENTLNWFINKKQREKFKLPHILDYNKK